MQPSIWNTQNSGPIQLSLFKDDGADRAATDTLSRIIYAETGASSLRAVEALASMARNLCAKSGRPLPEIIADETIFESICQNSARHQNLFVNSDRADFQMCARVVNRAARGVLCDTVMGATRFHRGSEFPDWSTAAGYVAEIDGLFFYP